MSTKSKSVKASEEEIASWNLAASLPRKDGKTTVNSWIRRTLNNAAKRQIRVNNDKNKD